MVRNIRSLVRPLVTVALTLALIYGFVVGMVPPESFMQVAVMVLGFWFAARSEARAG